MTLTYNEECLPHDLSVSVRDWQLFAKRLRKQKGSFRFFHCGEYGDETKRPHYHAILFGHDFADSRVQWKEDKAGRKSYVSEELSRIWGKGHCSIGDCTFESCAYVARYVMSKANGDLAQKRYERVNPDTGESWQVRPPYVTMSRRPGIGAGWLDKFKSDVYPCDYVVHDGRKFRPPTFYDRRLEEEELASYKRERIRNAKKREADQTPDRLRVRERVTERRLTRLKREN